MSKNLLKGRYTNLQQEETRLIDTNELVKKRIEELSVKRKKASADGFTAGLQAQAAAPEDVVSGVSEEEKTALAGKEAEKLLDQARQNADAILNEAKTEAKRLLDRAKADAEAQKAVLFSGARELGYQEGLEKAEQEFQIRYRDLEEKKRKLNEEYERKLEELEPQFIDTLTGIYEHIFHVDLQSYREVLMYLISSTMRRIEGVRSFMIHVSKEDYPYVSMQKKQLSAVAAAPNTEVEVVEDLTLSKNECLIETESGIFDCGLGTQLAELEQKLKLLSYEKP